MNMNDILYVLTVAEEKNFSRAAKKLLISQPALSQSINRVELVLQTKLFFRKCNTFSVTPAGEIFIEKGREILNVNQEMLRQIGKFKEQSDNTLLIGSSWFYNGYHLTKVVAAFRRQMPDIKLEIVEKISHELERHVVNGDLELCLIPKPLVFLKLKYESLYSENLLFVISKNYPLYHTEGFPPSSDVPGEYPVIDLALVKDEPFSSIQSKRFQIIQDELCEQAGFKPRIANNNMSWITVQSFITEALGVGFLPISLVESSSDNLNLAAYRVQGSNAAYPFMIAYKDRKNLSKAAARFIKVTKETTLSHYTK